GMNKQVPMNDDEKKMIQDMIKKENEKTKKNKKTKKQQDIEEKKETNTIDFKFKYEPVSGEILSIKSDINELSFAIPGGLLAIQLTIDPAFTRNDNLAGSMIFKSADITSVSTDKL